MCSLATWLRCHFLVSLNRIPSFPRGWDDANTEAWMLLWLVTHAQAGGRESIIFPSNSPSHQAAGSQKAEPCAPAYEQSTTGMLELNGTTAGGWQLLCRHHLLCFGKGGGSISTNHLEELCLFLLPLVLFKRCPHLPWLWPL